MSKPSPTNAKVILAIRRFSRPRAGSVVVVAPQAAAGLLEQDAQAGLGATVVLGTTNHERRCIPALDSTDPSPRVSGPPVRSLLIVFLHSGI